MDLIDTHCHINHRDFEGEERAAVDRAGDAGVKRLLVIGYDLASSRSAVSLAHEYGLWAAVGIHPESSDEWNPAASSTLQAIIAESPATVRAWGEIGLDYHWETQTRALQQSVFSQQIAFARALSPDLPLIIHNRDALADVLGVLKQNATLAPVVMHCFTGTVNDVKVCLDAGCYLGIGGVATFKKSGGIRDAVAYAPLDRLLLETDSPYLAPQSHRGRRNEPSYLPEIAATVASARGVTVEEIAAATTANSMKLFGHPVPWIF